VFGDYFVSTVDIGVSLDVNVFFYFVICKISHKCETVDVLGELERSTDSDRPFSVESLLIEVRQGQVFE